MIHHLISKRYVKSQMKHIRMPHSTYTTKQAMYKYLYGKPSVLRTVGKRIFVH